LYQIPHEIILTKLKSKIGDPRIIELINKFLKAGYFEPDKTIVNYNLDNTQGGLLTPLLANIVLHELDKFMDSYKPAGSNLKKGNKIRINPIYTKLAKKRGGSMDPVERVRI